MSDRGSVGNAAEIGSPGAAMTAIKMAGSDMAQAPHKRMTATQVAGALKQAQALQAQGQLSEASALCEQVVADGFDRPDVRYFLGWLYQQQQRWDEAIQQFQRLVHEAGYALSCYYLLGQCDRARGNLRTASRHLDEAIERVNLDALSLEEADELVQLCREAAEVHQELGEREQARAVCNALLGFVRSRGWNEQAAQVELLLKQAQKKPQTLPPMQQLAPQQARMTQAISLEHKQAIQEHLQNVPRQMAPQQDAVQQLAVASASSHAPGDLPDGLTGWLIDAEKAQVEKAAAQCSSGEERRVVQQRETTTDHLLGVITSLKLERRSGQLTVRRSEGLTAEEGTLAFMQGQVTLAKVGKRSGSDALNWLSMWRQARYVFLPTDEDTKARDAESPLLPSSPGGLPRKRNLSNEQTDRSRPGSSQSWAYVIPQSSVELNEAVARIDRARLSRLHRHIYLLIDGRRSIHELVSLVGKKAEEVSQVLADLERLGIIWIASPRPAE